MEAGNETELRSEQTRERLWRVAFVTLGLASAVRLARSPEANFATTTTRAGDREGSI